MRFIVLGKAMQITRGTLYEGVHDWLVNCSPASGYSPTQVCV